MREGETLEECIERNTIPEPNTGCLLWIAAVSEKGYAMTSVGAKTFRVSRLLFASLNGKIPNKMFVCHKCDQPSCVNDKHLFLGTAKQNTADMIAKGRRTKETTQKGDLHWSRINPDWVAKGVSNGANTHPEKRPRGETQGNHKLTEKSVFEIRAIGNSMHKQDIADIYGVSRRTIGNILQGRGWRHLLPVSEGG